MRFVNGAWYSAESYSGSGKTEPISTAVAPSEEISVANMGSTSPTATNWNGKSEKVAQETSNGTTDKNMSKIFSLTAGSYVVQAIVRGTSGSSVTLSANGQTASVALTGLEDGAPSTVQPNGIVDIYEPGTNHGWHKVEVAFTLTSDEMVTVTLTSAAEQWQLGDLKVLPGTIAKTKATTGVNLANAYVDVRGVSDFSFFERGENRNALINAAPSTLPESLPYNVIVNGTCAKLQLTDGNYSFNNSGSEFTATNVSYDRIFAKTNSTTRESSEPQYKISTIWLPFALSTEEATAAGTFWALDSYDGDNIRFVKVDAPAANTPYLFEPASDQPFLSLSSKTIPNSQLVTVTKGNISFVGVNERIEGLKSIADGVTYYGYSNNEFVQVGTINGVNIKPFRAYIETPAKAGARIGVLFGDENGSETGIRVVKPAAEPKGEQPIYNLSGQRVKMPNQKGIYIMGGKKFVIK